MHTPVSLPSPYPETFNTTPASPLTGTTAHSQPINAIVVGLPCEGGPERVESLLDTAAALSRAERCPVVLLHALWKQDELPWSRRPGSAA